MEVAVPEMTLTNSLFKNEKFGKLKVPKKL
jgi:hypothetical protein